MENERESGIRPDSGRQQSQDGSADRRPALADLDASADEAARVKGGRRGDPCDGGEVSAPTLR